MCTPLAFSNLKSVSCCYKFESCPSQNAVSHGMDEEGVAGAVPEGLVLVGVGECVGVGEALDDGDDDPEAVGGGQHDEQFVEVPAMDPSRTHRDGQKAGPSLHD